MKIIILSILYSTCTIVVFSQPTYDQFITRLKGGGSGFYNVLTFKFEEGFARLDDEKVRYIRKNVNKKQQDLLLYYKPEPD